MSPTPGRSTLITSAPNQASNCVQVGPDWTWVKSRMRTPSSAFVICSLLTSSCCRHARDDGHPVITVASVGHGPSSHDSSAVTGFPPCAGDDADGLLSLLSKNALRIEIADAAALGARPRIDHRVDQGRLARIHRRVDGALEIIRRGGVDAAAPGRLH